MALDPITAIQRPIKEKRIALCHPEKPHYAKDLCGSCYYWDHKTRKPEVYAQKVVTNRERRKKVYNKYYYAEKERERHLKRSFNITSQQYNEMLTAQGGVCALCGNAPKARSLSVDHNHKTGRIRGLLCFACNYGVGFLERRPEAIPKISEYLREP